MINEEKDKSISQQAQEYFESIDSSDKERSDEEIEQDNQKVQEWLNEIESTNNNS